MFPALKFKWRYILILAVFAFMVLLPFDWFLGQYKMLGCLIGMDTIVVVGLCLVMGYTGQVSLGQAAFFGTGMYTSAILSLTYGVNPWLAMLAGVAITSLLALLIGPIFRLHGNYLALATLAVGYIVWKVADQEGDHFGATAQGITGVPYLSIGGFAFDSLFKQYFLIWGVCLVILLISQNIMNSRIGRALRSIHGNEEAAQSLGINVHWFKVKIFVLSTVYASIAGSLYAHYGGMHASPGAFHPLVSIDLVVMAVVGGLASIWGAIFGVGTIEYLSNEILIHYGKWNMAIEGLIVVVILVLWPEGLFVAIKAAYQQDGAWFLPKWLWFGGKEKAQMVQKVFTRYRQSEVES